MFIHRDIPEWLPVEGQRVRISYPRMKKLCNGCYKNHLRKDCNNDKVSWKDYVKGFKQSNPEFPDLFYGKWSELQKTPAKIGPTEKDFNIPTTQSEWEEMKRMLSQCGVDEESAKSMIKERLLKFEKAKRVKM